MSSITPTAAAPSVLAHGGHVLPAVTVDTYNEELRDADGFVGDPGRGRGLRARRGPAPAPLAHPPRTGAKSLARTETIPLGTCLPRRSPIRSSTRCWPAPIRW